MLKYPLNAVDILIVSIIQFILNDYFEFFEIGF